jgi:catechol 2,3-dioxygenase-like lactoylglutathione lyase family enzyme
VAERVTAILKARDVAATIDWYTRIGFELRERHPETGTPTWCELARDGVVLQFLAGDTPWPGPPTFTGTIYRYPASVSLVYEEIRDDITPAWGPEVREWGTRELGLQDPDGYFLTFTEPAEPASYS